MQIAPALHKLAWRKNESVATALTNGQWKRGLRLLSTTEEVNQYIELWSLLQEVQLGEQPDDISWRFSANGTYSSSSAYRIQFVAAFPDHDWQRLWKTKAENKCKFFGWLILQNKLWTADRILKNGGQANAICTLCRSTPESAVHMMAGCSYSIQVWTSSASMGIILQQLPQTSYRSLKRWWTAMIGDTGTQASQQREQIVTYIAWNIWKERCRRVFDNKTMNPSQLVLLIKQDIQNWRTANDFWEE
ncbi:hypothetical protein HU200_002318 [Digitaria exilis]|uniref:Reverse transcriptase zinc-binding domain-containing protein n=1 Tax=Digitaria exilis TaxID=1010633 RepID=A0A835KWW2_9POAL|nr:hypothetical protein HU200_002318 [Digitaria exilis]